MEQHNIEFVKKLVNRNWLHESWAEYKAFALAREIITSTYLSGEEVTPNVSVCFKAFTIPASSIRVVILGQDPYFDGSATGMAFDNAIDKKPSPSLRNILTAILQTGHENWDGMVSDPRETYLGALPEQGVLLLNTALTTVAGKAGAHIDLWKPFTLALIQELNERHEDVVWVLWGAHAKSYKKYITNATHTIVENVHPSPLAHRTKGEHPFITNNSFVEVNRILTEKGKTPIKW